MCTALLSIEPGRPALLIGVRDELISRAWQPPARHWPDWPALIGGRDKQAGGTWLAVSPPGPRAACVLNGRGRPAPEAGRRSRGVLPLRAAAGQSLDRSALADFDPFHLVMVEADRAVAQTWDGDALAQRELGQGLHFAVNSGWALDLMPDALSRAADAGGAPGQIEPDNGRAHELGRIAAFLPWFMAAARPDPRPGQPVAEAWGDWFPLINGAGISPHDDRALVVRRDLGAGRIWGTTSISLIALWPEGLRYDFTGVPGDPAAWETVL